VYEKVKSESFKSWVDIKLYERLMEDPLCKNRASLYYISSLLSYIGKKYTKAENYLLSGISFHNDHWALNTTLYWIYVKLNKIEKSKEQFKRLVKLSDKENQYLDDLLEKNILGGIFTEVEAKYINEYLNYIMKGFSLRNSLPIFWKGLSKTIFNMLINIEQYSEEKVVEVFSVLKVNIGGYKQATIPLLYLDVGIRYLKKGDQRAIYDLSKEERQVFKEFVLDKRNPST